MKTFKPMLVSILVSSALFTGQVMSAESDLNDVINAGDQITQSASESQQRINDVVDKTQSKLAQFKTLNKELDGLSIYNEQMQRQINSQLEEVSQIKDSMQQVAIIERQISPLMARMIDTLDQFVALDIPFLSEEREQRIAGLKSMLDRADIAVSEKFRRVLEAYQVETDYGRTIEAYSGLLTVDGIERDVEFLRIGRVSFVYQSRDGSQMGAWDKTSNNWQEISQSMRTDINKGIRIARKQLAPDLIVVPVNSSK